MSGNGCLEKVVFKLLDIPDNEEEEESDLGVSNSRFDALEERVRKL